MAKFCLGRILSHPESLLEALIHSTHIAKLTHGFKMAFNVEIRGNNLPIVRFHKLETQAYQKHFYALKSKIYILLIKRGRTLPKEHSLSFESFSIYL